MTDPFRQKLGSSFSSSRLTGSFPEQVSMRMVEALVHAGVLPPRIEAAFRLGAPVVTSIDNETGESILEIDGVEVCCYRVNDDGHLEVRLRYANPADVVQFGFSIEGEAGSVQPVTVSIDAKIRRSK